jgi:hypothetical protein
VNKAETCSMRTNSIVPARRISVIYFVRCGSLASMKKLFDPLRFHFEQVLPYFVSQSEVVSLSFDPPTWSSGWPNYIPDAGFHFHRLLRLARLQ